jgi:hypothetical protein
MSDETGSGIVSGEMRLNPLYQIGGLIYEKMAAIMAAVPAIGKDQRNQEQRYSFRGIDDVYNALHGLFAQHGVFVIPEVLDADYVQAERVSAKGRTNLVTDAHLRIAYHFYATDGSRVTAVVAGESRDYADKATNQATSSAMKYLLLQVFLIPTQETVEADHKAPIVGEAVPPPDELPEEEIRRLHENAVKAEILNLVGGDKQAASELWDAGVKQGKQPDEILELATKATAGSRAQEERTLAIEQLAFEITRPIPEKGKADLEAQIRKLAALTEKAGMVPLGERVHPFEDWLHLRLSQWGQEHVASLKVAELQKFLGEMQATVAEQLEKGGSE